MAKNDLTWIRIVFIGKDQDNEDQLREDLEKYLTRRAKKLNVKVKEFDVEQRPEYNVMSYGDTYSIKTIVDQNKE